MGTQVGFYHPTSKKFNQGETWISSSGTPVAVIGVEKYLGATDDRISDYGVTYTYYENGKLVTHERDCWNFQVKYTHKDCV